MSFSLYQIALVLLLFCGVIRVGILIDSLSRFVRLFDRQLVEGSRLLFALEIPGLERFVRDEVFLGIVPYGGLVLSIWFFELNQLAIGDLSTLQFILVGVVLPVWVILDVARSISIRRKLNKLHEESKMFQTITGSALGGLKLFVRFRGGVRKTVARGTIRAIAGFAKVVLRSKKKEDEQPTKSEAALEFVEKVTEFPGKMADKFTEFTKDNVDSNLQKRFKKYAERSTLKLAIITLWGLLPAILLSIISIL